jgi:hypothetical protein
MFAWYKQSAKCYVYLADVGEREVEEPVDIGRSSLERRAVKFLFDQRTQLNEEIRRSKWFTRAWTLQELLAPSSVQMGAESGQEFVGMEFFSAKWKSLGSKLDLKDLISSTTGIQEEYLTGASSLASASISMRMSWAAERRATRAEDIAYSLLGIFDVNMPLLYGEGKVKAFRRLQEEIMKISEDETLFAWESSELTASPSSGDALASDPRDFTEARDLLPFASDESIVPHALTHRGLRISLQINPYSDEIRPIRSPIMLRSPFELYAAVLRCHVAHDFNHAVVIPLSHFTGNVYIRDTTTNVGLLPVRLLSQFRTIDEVYIRNSLMTSLTSSVRRRFGFLIRNLPPGLKISHAFPKESWNSKDKILQGEGGDQGRRWWHASLDLRLDQPSPFPSTQSAFLSLGCRQEIGDSEVRSWCHLDDMCWPKGEGYLEDFHNSAFQRLPRYEVRQFRDWRGPAYMAPLRVTVSQEKVFGQQMFIVDVEFALEDKLAVAGQPVQNEDGMSKPMESLETNQRALGTFPEDP